MCGLSRAFAALSFLCAFFLSGASPVAAQAVLQYLGGQGFDPRDLRTLDVAMAFSGTEVAGSFRLSSVCQGSAIENGGQGTFSANLTGVWESPEATILGRWTATSDPCSGLPTQNEGDVSILIQPGPQGQPAVVVTFTGQVLPTPSVHFFPLKNQQVADGGGQSGAPVPVDYHGGLAFDPRDGRTMDMSLLFRGRRVNGTVRVPADCSSTGLLTGGDLRIEAVLTGPWEDRASVIQGTWGGTTIPCGATQSMADRGTLRIVMDRRPDGGEGVIVNLIGTAGGGAGTFFYFTPLGKVFVGGQGAGPAVAMAYQGGRSWDPRDPSGQSMPLSVSGDLVSGTIRSAGICDFANGLFFPSVDVSVQATLRGPWEEQGSIVHGAWGGDVQGCANPPSPPPSIQRGDICIFMGPAPGGDLAAIARIAAGGSFRDYYYTPLRQNFGTGIAPANVGLPETRLTYPDGKAWTFGITDGRRQRLEIAFQGNRVHGSFHTDPICSGNTVSLAGGDAFFEGTLDGDWESPNTTVTGVWGGNTRFCDNSTKPDFGMIQITMGATPGGDPGIIVQFAGLQGRPYAYFHTPLGQVATSFGGRAVVPDPLFGNAILNCHIPLVGAVGPIAVGVGNQQPGQTQQPGGRTGADTSIVLLLDASGSMEEQDRMIAAKAAARRVVGQMTAKTEVALIVFYECGDIRVEQAFTTDPAAVSAALEPIGPNGGTPLGGGIAFAKEYMRANASGTTQRLVVLTDGNESCGGDLMGAVKG